MCMYIYTHIHINTLFMHTYTSGLINVNQIMWFYHICIFISVYVCVYLCKLYHKAHKRANTQYIFTHIFFSLSLEGIKGELTFMMLNYIKVSYKYRETKRVWLVLWWGVRVSQKLVPMTSILKVRICLFVENRKGKKGYFGTKNIYVYICLIHVAVQQKLMHHCKMIILQLKKKQTACPSYRDRKQEFFCLHWEIQWNQACLD